MQILFFDTETTGKPVDYNAKMTDLENWPRVIQQGWVVTDENGDILISQKYLIKPDGWVMPTGDFWVRHGYTQEQNEKEGIPIASILDLFISHLSMCDLLVAHNMKFDYNVVGAEMIRASKRSTKSKVPQFCTMQASVDICQLKGKYGFKFPSLDELYQHLFKKSFVGAHDALADVVATKECFFEMVRLGHNNLLELNKANA